MQEVLPKIQKKHTKIELIKHMCANMYDLKNLTKEEEEMMKDSDRMVEILLSPIAYLMKKDI